MTDYLKDPTVWIVIGVLFTVIGGLISGFASYQATRKQDRETTAQAKKVNEQQRELIEKSIGIIDRQNELNAKSAEIREQQEGLSKKQEEMFLLSQSQLREQISLREKAEVNERLALELAESQKELGNVSKEIYNNSIGKDSYCYAVLSMSNEPDNENVGIYLYHVGKYSLKNLEVSIVNTDIEFGRLLDRKADFTNIQQDYHNYTNPYYDKISSLTHQDVPTPLKSFKTVRRDQKSFHIRFKTDSRTWYQRVLLRRVGGFEIKPEGSSLPNDYDNWFLSQFQVYELDSEGYNKVHRYEKILMESTVDDGYDTQSIKTEGSKKIWRRFPLRKDEVQRLPFSMWPSLHWDGAHFDNNPALPSSK